MPPCRRAGAALPGRFAETLDSCPPTGQLDFFFTVVPPQDNWKLFFKVVGLDNLDIFFAGKNSPWRGLGRASMPGRWRGRGLLEQGGAGCCAGVRLRICRFSLFEKLLKSLLRPVGHGS